MADKDLDEKDELDTESKQEDEANGIRASDPGEEAEGLSADADDDSEDSEDDAEEEPVGKRSRGGAEDLEQSQTPTHVGAATKYVHAAFFGAGILTAYLSGKILWTIWNELAEWSYATQKVPVLLRYAEDERESFTLMAGALIGVIAVIQTYRKEKIRKWADEVAGELAKVTWPTRDIVTNGTIVVVIASLIATSYIGILDQLWSFLTNLVYGA